MEVPTLHAQWNGTKKWSLGNGKLHRLDGPAVLYADGTEEWWVNGKHHRVDGPAVKKRNGFQAWYFHGVAHRDGGPAIITATGTQEWWVDGYLHRVDGPAKIHPDGTREWWVNEELHRLDGPAFVRADGYEEYWVHGKQIWASTLSLISQSLTKEQIIVCFLAHPNLNLFVNHEMIKQKTGWDPNTIPTRNQLEVWYMLAGLT